jgi:UDP-N-acetylglucosamine:LPS N-acetylglucosamine transferase
MSRAGAERDEGELLVVTSAGGVLLDVLALARSWGGSRRFVAVRATDTAEELATERVRFRSESTERTVLGLAGELVVALVDLIAHRPMLVVSAGTRISVPWFTAAWLLRVPAVWVETLNLVDGQGRAARWCTRLADLVAVQRADRLALHARSVSVGGLY